MGQAKQRGSFEERKAAALKNPKARKPTKRQVREAVYAGAVHAMNKILGPLFNIFGR
jgi:hypothetical protein